MNLLDIDTVFNECPCVCDSIRQIYIFGRFKNYHGLSKCHIDNGTNRMFPGVDTKKFYDFIQKLVSNPHNILIFEVMSSVLCNVQVFERIQQTGYILQLLEITKDPEKCLQNILRRKHNEKSQNRLETLFPHFQYKVQNFQSFSTLLKFM